MLTFAVRLLCIARVSYPFSSRGTKRGIILTDLPTLSFGASYCCRGLFRTDRSVGLEDVKNGLEDVKNGLVFLT